MKGITFKKDNNTITIDNIYGSNGNYCADISYLSSKNKGNAKGQDMFKLASKLLKENFLITNNISNNDKLKVFQDLLSLIK
jgi:hypothetical protein